MISITLALLLQVGGELDAGLAASRAGRYEEASRLLGVALARSPSYTGLVALGVAQGRLGRLQESERTLDAAVALNPKAASAWRERGGLRFLAKDYEGAAADFQHAWRLQRDDYTARMLGTSLHLAGRPEAALDAWNKAGVPLLRKVEITGTDALPEEMVRREVAASEGGLLTASQVRESRLRLEETGAFSSVTLRPLPLEKDGADLEVAVKERHGFGSWPQLLGMTAANALGNKARLRYYNLFPGFTPGIDYKWEKTQPRLRTTLDWVRPLGLDVNLAFTGVLFTRPSYDIGGPVNMRASGLDLALRRVVGPATVAELGYRTRSRTFSRVRPDAMDGRWSGLQAGLDHRLLKTRRQEVDASLRYFRADGLLGSDFDYGVGSGAVRYQATLAGDDGTSMPGSVLATRLLVAHGDGGTPLDEMFAPGAASEMDFPLRGHRQKRSGVLGRTPIGRRLGLVNVEWRQRLFKVGRSASVGGVAFFDTARIEATAQEQDGTFYDGGFGVRLRLMGMILRADYGFSLSGDGNNALTVGFGQVF